MKKFICLAVSLLMLLAVLASCSVGGGTDTGTTPPDDGSDVKTEDTYETNENGDIVQKTNIPDDADFEGVTIGISTRGVKGREQYSREFSAPTATDPVDVKITKRNNEVQNELNVKLKVITDGVPDGTGADAIINYVKAEYEAGAQSDVDVISQYAAYSTAVGLRGYYVNLLDTKNLTYLNTNNLYWNQSYVSAGTCYGQLYTIVGDLNLSVYDKSIVTFFNAELAENYAGINVDEFYAKVLAGENAKGGWTYELLYQMVNEFTYEDNGNENVVDPADKVPYASVAGSEDTDGYLSAWDMQMLKTNADGTHSLTIDGNTKLEKGISNMQELYNLQGIYRDSIANTFDSTFVGGNALFDVDILYRNASSNDRLRKCGFKYAVLPLCKYDENQMNYYTTPQDAYNAMSILNNRTEKFEAIGATLELMSYKSYNDVRPYYINKMVKTTFITDGGANEIAMLDLSMRGTGFTTETIYSGQLEYISTRMWRDAIGNNQSMTERWGTVNGNNAVTEAVIDFDQFFEASMS